MSDELNAHDETLGDEKTPGHNIFLLKLEIDDNNWVTVAVNMDTRVKDVVAKVLKRPHITKSTLCIVYNGASALDPEHNLYETMKLDPSGDNIFIVLIPDDGTDEHKQAITELFPDQVNISKPWGSLPTHNIFSQTNLKKKKKKRKTVQNRKTTRQFATDLHKFVSVDVNGLDAVVFDMKKNEESAKINFTNRVSKYQKRSDKRRGTITKLKKELNEHNSSPTDTTKMKKMKNKSNQHNSVQPTDTKMSQHNDNSSEHNSVPATDNKMKNKYKKRDLKSKEEKDENWLQYLNSVRQQLSQEMWAWNLIEANINLSTNVSDNECNDKYINERRLICQMQTWMNMYGMPAMRANDEVTELKKQLLKMNEEADQLDEEVVQVTQQLFNMENEKNELQLQLNLLNQQLNKYKSGSPFLLQSESLSPRSGRPNKPFPSKPLPVLAHSKSQTLSNLSTNELYNDNETDQITELQRKCGVLQQSNISLKKEVIEFKIYQKQVRKNINDENICFD